METLIKRLDSWLKNNRPDYYAKLQPGLSGEAIAEFEKTLGLEMPTAFKALYQWRNGQQPSSFEGLQYNQSFMNIEAIKEARQVLNDLFEGEDAEEENWWKPQWVPFLDNGGGDHLCIDMDGTFTGQKGQIIEFWHDWEDRSIQYANLENWLETFVTSLEKNLWMDDDGDFPLVDEDAWETYYTTHNPGYPIENAAGD